MDNHDLVLERLQETLTRFIGEEVNWSLVESIRAEIDRDVYRMVSEGLLEMELYFKVEIDPEDLRVAHLVPDNQYTWDWFLETFK